MQLYHTVGIFLNREEVQLHGPAAGRDQRNALPDESRNHVNHELINSAGVEKRSDDPSSAHHPDVFAFLPAQALRKFGDRLGDKLKAGEDFLWRLARECVMPHAAHGGIRFSFFLKLHDHVVSLASPDNRIDRFKELSHAVIARGAWPVQPVIRAIFARDKAVSADGDHDDDFALGHGSGYDAVCFVDDSPNAVFLRSAEGTEAIT